MADGNWCKSSPAPSPLWWDASEARLLRYFPEFLSRVKFQSLTVVAGLRTHPCWLPSFPLSPSQPFTCVPASPTWTSCSPNLISGSASGVPQTKSGAACKSGDDGHFTLTSWGWHDSIQLWPSVQMYQMTGGNKCNYALTNILSR